MIILDKPNFPPYVCISCGVGTGRKWFVSLNLPLDNYFNPVNEGNVFYCDECWEGLATKVAKAAQVFVIGHEPWFSADYIQPEYENETELVEEVKFGPGSTNTSIAEHSEPASTSEPTPESDDPESESTTTDEQGGPVSEFRVFFGGDTGSSD